EALEKVVKEHPVLLNRAPTLHRLSIQAFEPKLIDGKAIRLHPLVCTAFNADFDGDQMAVHLPLSNEAQAEARLLMLASNNILNLKDGKPVVIPTQDMVLGNYYLTIETPGLPNEFNFYSSFLEAERAYEDNIINLHTRIVVDPNNINSKFSDAQKNQYLVTTFGKLKFNAVLPNSFPFLQEESKDNTNLENGTPAKYFINKGEDPHKVYDTPIPEPFKKSYLGSIISEVFKDKNLDLSESSKMLDRIKDLGFKTSTIAGFTISIADINVYKDKKEMIDAAEQKIRGFEVAYDDGELTTQELNNQITRTWSDTQRDMGDKINKDGFTKENHIFMMKDSGARGSASNFNQLAGMRGAMGRSVNLNYKGARLEREKERAVIKIPVKNSFREGINVSEFFNSTYGGRKGSTDTALKTANSGYFTRRFVDVAQDIVVVEDDCNTDRSEVFEAITTHGDNGKVNVLVNLKDRILGRYTARDVINEQTGEVVVPKNTFITDSEANLITDNGISKVEVRTVFTCNSYRGVCAKCYGKNLATNNVVEIGEAVGVIAGQSIGEPSTQLTMRTFHTGGVASESDITQGFPRLLELLEGYNRAPVAYISDVRGVVKKVEEKSGIIEVEIEDASASKTVRTKAVSQDKGVKTFNIEPRYLVPRNTNIIVKKGDKIYPGTPLTKGPIMAKELTRADSTISSKDYIKKEMLKLFRSQKIEISDKHIEIIIRQMYNKLTIFYAGDTDLVPGSRISIDVFKETNAEVFSKAKITEAGDSNYKEGEIVYRDDIDQVNLELEANGKAPAKFRLMEPATAKSLSMGIKMASRQSDSLLSAVSFEDSRIGLTKAAIEGKTDYFYGLKENAMIGGLIPAGTGIIRDTVFEYDDTNAKKTE
ncbi:MAG: DNA-directed RNA polymerase subunit beta', partial [Acholeplasmatales bacterium]|nr:DNA-directed RNA polymerase subunit beta' [Acholeplasmatales bacterium]